MHKEIQASYANLQEMARRLKLSEKAYRRAVALARLTPNRTGWFTLMDRFLLTLGALLIVAGIAAFFAGNWAALSHWMKFTLIQCGILGSVLIAWRFGIDSPAGKTGLFAAAFLTGVLLAVFGQIFQTGADPYGLFLTWALLILPWAVIGRQAGLWLLFQLLLNLSIIMYYTQVLHPPDGWWELTRLLGPLVWLGTTVMDSTLASYLFLFNLAALILWEFGNHHGVSWMQGSLFPRLIAFAIMNTVLIPTLIIIVAAGIGNASGLHMISPILWLAATALALYYYQHRRHDLFILTLSLLGAIMVITSLFIRHLMTDSGSLLLLALMVMAQVAGAAWWLREVAQRWEANP
ncbi:MAG: DUF2157 domain-containing protein [Candidatus Thiodiazotropha sp. (ex Monitilora ramsayi)]|nr:DUF2157 domain-containing protein [Candidatus Thiodiazotropha sp. (ex Monitilora ramsayi)]